jgi:chaperonin GroEL (HSP60 family)
VKGERITQVDTIPANYDKWIGGIIAGAMKNVDKDGVNTVRARTE